MINARTCYDCGYFKTSYFCGYEQCICEIYGSLDIDQNLRHPDTSAQDCQMFVSKKDYKPKKKDLYIYGVKIKSF